MAEELLSLCTEFDLAVTNTLFNNPDKCFYSWSHPRSKHWHLLDYVLTRRQDVSDVCSTRAMRGANCDTDHVMIRSKLKLQLTPPRRKTAAKQRTQLNVSALQNPEISSDLARKMDAILDDALSENNTTDELWEEFKTKVYKTSSEVLGQPKRKNADWFNEKDGNIQVLLENRRKLYLRTLEGRCTRSSKLQYQNSKSVLQRDLRDIENQWWLDKAHEIQQLNDAKDSKNLFAALKKVYGPSIGNTAPVASSDGTVLHTEKSDIMNRWVEHFSQLLNNTPTVNVAAIERVDQCPIDDSLSVPPTLAELGKAIQLCSNGKSPGIDRIPAEIFKSGGKRIKEQLLHIITESWNNETLPKDLRDGKRKGDRHECSNYRGIALLSIAGKLYANILVMRLQSLSEKHLPESQCGFRPSRGTTDMIFTLRQIQEKCREQNLPLYICFVDFRKAFDSVPRDMLWRVLGRYGCPGKFINIIKLFHEGMEAQVMIGGELSDTFPVTNGVKQGCTVAPTLFALYLAAVLEVAKKDQPAEGVWLLTRQDGNPFNLRRLSAKTKVEEVCVQELLYADDSAFVAHSEAELQRTFNCFSAAAADFGLTINASKTEVMFQPPPSAEYHDPSINFNGSPLPTTKSFTYLGSTVTHGASLDKEINNIIQAAYSSFARLRDRLWHRHGVKLSTKIAVYRAIILPTLLYSSETYILYRRNIKRLSKVLQGQLRSIMGIRWHDRISNVEVL